ncbi:MULTISPECIES: substrate-binding domain-containing protein [unclassified Agarivorans]|uniref:substrate-binding domain-containing protein n=1 Tax=unclassified Agarivorans TaxID=2636026 RepID=UPI003D7E9042
MKSLLIILAVFFLSFEAMAQQHKLRYLVIPKSIDSPFFDAVEKGCMQAAAELNVECLYLGPEEADARFQDKIISQQIESGIDGIAVSVINSRVLTKRSMLLAAEKNIPVITFDSDFSEVALLKNPQLRYSYIGSDNFQFGYQLGLLAQRLRPQGGVFCVLSGHRAATNMQERISGLYAALGNNNQDEAPLWEEHTRCPIFADDDADRGLTTLDKMIRLHMYSPDLLNVLITLGMGAQATPLKYTDSVSPYLDRLNSRQLILLFGDTLPKQKQLLAEGFAHGNVGQRPFDMGYQAIYALHSIGQGKTLAPIIYTALEICEQGQQPLCQ